MAFVVTEACIRCKYTDCVDVCPVDCFHETADMLVIDPAECIDCAVCVPECPVDAIYAEEDVPASHRRFIGLNAELAAASPVLSVRKAAHPEADQWKGRSGKAAFLDPSAGPRP